MTVYSVAIYARMYIYVPAYFTYTYSQYKHCQTGVLTWDFLY